MTHFETASHIVHKLENHGHTTYFAGGWVRDYLMNHPSDDIDIATSASVEEIETLFPKTIPVGKNFGIIIVVEGNHQYEVATFRRDMGYVDGRRPTGYLKSNPEEDAIRRDFTINGMFYDPATKRVFDYVDGRADIQARIIRAIGDPHERFLEDRLRMMRAIRYACRFHFTIEKETKKAILAHADQLFPAVAIERVWQELLKMSRFPNFEHGLIMLFEYNLLKVILPMLTNIPKLPPFPPHTPLLAKLFELFPNASLEEKLSLCNYFKLSNKEKKFATSYHTISRVLEKDLTPCEWAHLYADPHFEITLSIQAAKIEKGKSLITHHHDRIHTLSDAIDRIKRGDPILKSHHLIERGIAKGKKLGELLKEGERLAINEHLTTPESILNRLL